MPKERHFGRVSQIAAYVTVGFKRDCNGGRFFYRVMMIWT